MAAYETGGLSDEWYTPSYVFEALGLEFDMDVASPGASVVPWIPAKMHITEGSLGENWRGRVWMNPPFGGRNGYVPWAKKFVQHGNGVALAPNRTAAAWFQDFAGGVDGLFFWAPKMKFININRPSAGVAGYGSVLFACGADAVTALSALHGKRGIYARV